MDKFVITITRQFGSLGRPIARELSKLLDVEFFDRDIVEMTAKKMNRPVSEISLQEERSSKYSFMSYPLGMGTVTNQQDIFKVQSEIINSIADRQSCIIVGRCSDYILKDHPNCMHVFIYAPYEARLNNCIEQLNLDKDIAIKNIRDVDRARESYHKLYAGYAPDDMRYKDVLINSARLGIMGTAEQLAAMAQAKFYI